jgi:hypothetical protein
MKQLILSLLLIVLILLLPLHRMLAEHSWLIVIFAILAILAIIGIYLLDMEKFRSMRKKSN